MSAPLLIDLAARRAAQPADRGSIVQAINEGAEALLAQVSGWQCTYLRESHIVGAERALSALQGLLTALRAFVPIPRQ
jgi:hypothetical protein